MNPLNLVPNWLLFLIIGGLSAGVGVQQMRVSNAQASTARAHTDLATFKGSVAETTRLLQAANDRSHIADLNRKQEAMDAKDVRNKKLAVAAAGTQRSLDRLRSAINLATGSDPVPGTTIAACTQPAAAFRAVLLECATQLEQVGVAADGHVSDLEADSSTQHR